MTCSRAVHLVAHCTLSLFAICFNSKKGDKKYCKCVHSAQVKRAEKHLLEALYGHISSLGKFESDTLLEEDPDIMQRRAATKKVCSHHSAVVLVFLAEHCCMTMVDTACSCLPVSV